MPAGGTGVAQQRRGRELGGGVVREGEGVAALRQCGKSSEVKGKTRLLCGVLMSLTDTDTKRQILQCICKCVYLYLCV